MKIGGRVISLLFLAGTAGCSSVEPQVPPMSIADPPSFMVFFAWDDASISQQGENTIKQFANWGAKNGRFFVNIVGHTDLSGGDSYNLALSRRRANAVEAAVIRYGVPADWIVVQGKGETQPLLKTPNGAREPQNRRVELYLRGERSPNPM